MKLVFNQHNLAVVTAENLEDSILLQKISMGMNNYEEEKEDDYKIKVVEKPKRGRPFGKKTTLKEAGQNAWKHKNRKECDFCGKKYKNIKLHILTKHPQQYKEIFGNITSTGKKVDDLETKGFGRPRNEFQEEVRHLSVSEI